MKHLIVAMVLGAAALAGGPVAHAANNTKATTPSQSTDISSQHRHRDARGPRPHHRRHHGHARPYYRNYGYYPRPHHYHRPAPYGYYGGGHRW